MDAEGWRYRRPDNGFPWIEDFARAQKLMPAQLRVNGPKGWDAIARQRNPIHEEIFRGDPLDYYWTTPQSEWASDLVFREAAARRRLYPWLVRHALTSFGSPQVLRFLGRSLRQDGEVPRTFQGQVETDLRQRPEGVRIKHQVNGNSLKLYDKVYTPVGSVLRPAMTLNNPGDFRVYRSKEGDPQGPPSWPVLRRGIADLHRRAPISQQANDRNGQALASVDDSIRLEELTRPCERPTPWKRQRVRALHPFQEPDVTLLEAVGRGEFILNSFRNKDLQALFFAPAPDSRAEKRRRSAWVRRQLRRLPAHSIIKKVTHENRYPVPQSGRQLITAILAARKATVSQWSKVA